jgi:putative SOS response-associated peptidase YedK
MCRRYYRSPYKPDSAGLFGLSWIETAPLISDSKSDISPTTFQPVIREQTDPASREIVMMRWGMIPRFAKSDALYKACNTMNAKAETLTTRTMWSVPLHSGRCLVPVSGFYEWKVSDIDRQFYAVEMTDGRPFALAGLWDAWKNPVTDQEVLSYSIITTDSNVLLHNVSTRMPAIIAASDYKRWLSRDDPNRPPYDLLRPFPPEDMTIVEAFDDCRTSI